MMEKRIGDLEEDVRDIHICLNDQCDRMENVEKDVKEIKNNHLHEIKADLTYMKGRQDVLMKVIGWGLAGLALLFTVLQLTA